MTSVWALAALWLGLALIASLLSIWFRISTALSEIVVGTIAQLIIGAVIGSAVLGTDESWVKFLSGIGAIVLTFLAGAELDPQVFKLKWKEAAAVGLASFFFPFLCCAAAAYYGTPGANIIDLAAQLKVELLVIGAKGHSAIYERLIGIRADRIMQL